MKRIKLFRDGIGFSFWHFYGKPHGTAIRFRRARPGLFGVNLERNLGGDIRGLAIGFWWTFYVTLCAVHAAQFSAKGRAD